MPWRIPPRIGRQDRHGSGLDPDLEAVRTRGDVRIQEEIQRSPIRPATFADSLGGTLHGVPQVSLKPLSHLHKLGLTRYPYGPIGEVDLIPIRLRVGAPTWRDLIPAQIVNETKRLLPGFMENPAEGRRHQPPDLCGPLPLLRSRRRPADRLALGFGTQLVPKEVVFPQGEVVMLTIP